MSFSVSHFGMGDVRVEQVDLRREAVNFMLSFFLVGKAVVAEGDIYADLWGARLTVAGADGRHHGLGTIRPDLPIRVRRTGMMISCEFRRQISAAELRSLDESRRGGDLSFGLVVFGDGASGAASSEKLPVQFNLTAKVSRSDWIARLKSAGAANIALFEISMPLLPETEDWRELRILVTKSQDLFLEAHYDETVVTCRKALEACGRLLSWPEKWAADALARATRERRAMTKLERERLLLGALHHFANPAAHPGETFDREEARLVLVETMGAIGRLTALSLRAPVI